MKLVTEMCKCQDNPIESCAQFKEFISICLCADIGYSIEAGLSAPS